MLFLYHQHLKTDQKRKWGQSSYLRIFYLRFVEIQFIFHLLPEAFLLFLGVVLQLDHFVNLLANLPIRILQLVSLIRQLVHIVEQRIVLLFSLDERSDDFVNGCDASRLFDLLESVLNHLHIPQILVHQSLFLTVGCHDFGETQLQDRQWVLEFSIFGLGVLRGRCRSIIIDFVFFLLLVQFLLVTLDFRLEVILVFFMLSSQSDSLVDLLLRETLGEQGCTVLRLGLLVHLLRQVLEPPRLAVLVHDLLPQHVDLLLILLVLRLRLVQAELFILAGMLLAIETNVVTLVVDGFRFDLADILFLLSLLVLHLLDLVLEDL